MFNNLDFDLEDIMREPDDTDHLLTNFEKDVLSIYEKALSLYKDDTLYISKVAYDRYGNQLADCYALRSKIYKDRSDFWRIFDNIPYMK